MDPKLTSHYSAAQRKPTFLKELPVLHVKQAPYWPTLLGLILSIAVVVAALAPIIHHIN